MPSITPRAYAHLEQRHGIITVDDLTSCGVSTEQTRKLVADGDLVTVLPGAYRSSAVPLTELGRCAAVIAAHPECAIAGPTAAKLWEFRRAPADLRVHVIAPPASHPTTEKWVVAYRTAAIHPTDIVTRPDGIRITSRGRTAFDLARWLNRIDLRSVIDQALHDGSLTDADLRSVAADWVSPRRKWATTFLQVLDSRGAGAPAESHREVQVEAALVEAGIRGLVRQHEVTLSNGRRVRFDFAIPAIMWALEVDGFPRHFEIDGARSDAERDRAALDDGWVVRRVVDSELAGLAVLARTIAGEVSERRNALR
jgi:very-short-patch-repair endonuclease